MVVFLFVCSALCASTGARMVWTALFGRRPDAANVPTAQLVRDARGEVAEEDQPMPRTARLFFGIFLLAVAFAAIYIVERVPG